MRWRPLTWLLLSVMFFVAALCVWRWADEWEARKAGGEGRAKKEEGRRGQADHGTTGPNGPGPIRLLSQGGNLNSPAAAPTTAKTNAAAPEHRLADRLSNTTKSFGELSRSDNAILLENALLDTEQPGGVSIPDHLRAQGDPGSYIVQSRGPLDNGFRALLKEAGARIVSYIPNNAYLVIMEAGGVERLKAQAQAVLPYEPYYKLKGPLLRLAVEGEPLRENSAVKVLLFPGAREGTRAELERIGAQIQSEEQALIGVVLQVRPPVNSLAALAGLRGVQIVEMARPRILANDLSRARVAVAADTRTATNYLGLTGTNVLVNINDTGVDTNHPDLSGRVLFDVNTNLPPAGSDLNGHGTHVAGIIAGSGLKSPTVTNAAGSIMPGTNFQFRGLANGAKLFSIALTASDTYLQETAALTNALFRTNTLISNNSWTYGDNEYDLAAASYDAAVRDALPLRTGSQPILYVFPAGNAGSLPSYQGGGNDDGIGGDHDTILSPGTAKNVITVGAVEQLRNITNKVVDRLGQTNAVWHPMTDSSDQVAGYSSRGNVGIGIEGDFGRYKPDVVAPGSFVVSTRSGQWDQGAYYSTTNHTFQFFPNLMVTSNSPFVSGVFAPGNAVQLIVRTLNRRPPAPLLVDVTPPGGADVIRTNLVSIPPDGMLAPLDDFWQYMISNSGPGSVTFDLETELVTTNDFGTYFMVLSNLNNTLCAPPYYYRYESGTSMAAAQASGMLALMQEFFEQRLHLTNSPALMKALLINGARSLGNAYNFSVTNNLNLQGWGLIQLPGSLHSSLSNLNATAASMFVYDQSPTNALATGQRHTRRFKLNNPTAQLNYPLRVTLVWTDPAANPAASVKLVNDLDLVVTNLDNTNVYFGNDIQANNDFNLAWDTNSAPNVDVVNNVENVYLRQPLGTNYSITVIGKRVNVNAVYAQTNDVVQDYALVVSSGDGQVTNALMLMADEPTVSATLPLVTRLTNSLPASAEAPTTGAILIHQRVGANTPLLGTNMLALTNDANAVLITGMTNQWHFYVLSNDLDFTNAAFVTFQPEDLSVPRIGVRETNLDNATRLEADIDMYVSLDSSLTNLNTNAISAAYKSLGRGGLEGIVLSNALPKGVYYVGIKSEDQMGAEYGFLGIFSQLPFGGKDEHGNPVLRLLPVPRPILPGTPPNPQGAQVFAFNVEPIKIRRVVLTNTWTHDLPGNLLGNLSHNRKFVVLNNHTCATDPNGDCITNTHAYIYEDNREGDVPGSRPSDGPGSLRDFNGDEGSGLWMITMVNNFPSGTGRIDRAFVKLQREVGNGLLSSETVQPLGWVLHSIDVPAGASALTICVLSNTLPLDLYVRFGADPTQTAFDYHFAVPSPDGGCFAITPFDTPPLMAGRYHIGIYNPNNTAVPYLYSQDVTLSSGLFSTVVPSFGGPTNLLDDAVTYSSIFITNHLQISSLGVALQINHPRISDLAITLISPSGTRVLLMEDRGALSTNGIGSAITNFATVTNLLSFYTNDFDAVALGLYAPGAVFEGWNVLSNLVTVVPDWTHLCLSNHLLVLGDGVVSNTLPTTNSTNYRLSFKVTHAPYLVGTVGWWPFDQDATDIFGSHNGLLCGNPHFVLGEVIQAYNGDGVGTSVEVPRCPELDVGLRRGFSVEGWIKPAFAMTSSAGLQNGDFEAGAAGWTWLVNSGGDFIGTCMDGTLGAVFNSFQARVGTGVLYQAFSTVPGQTYTVSFDFGSFGVTNGYPQRLQIEVRDGSSPTNGAETILGGSGSLAAKGNTGVSLSQAGSIITVVDTSGSTNLSPMSTAYFRFTALSQTSTIVFRDQTGSGGQFTDMSLDNVRVQTFAVPAPLVEWSDYVTNSMPQGVQFWVAGLPGTNAPGALCANLWDTNGQPHLICTATNAITNGGWQHVALTYDARTLMARIYTNGQLAVAAAVSATPFVPATYGDLYFGYHPARRTVEAVRYAGPFSSRAVPCLRCSHYRLRPCRTSSTRARARASTEVAY